MNILKFNNTCCSHLDLYLEIDKGRLIKSDDLPFPISNFPFINSDIPAASAYRIYKSYIILSL